MGLLFVEYLSGPRIYECSSCHAHLADYKHIISKVMSYFVLVFSFFVCVLRYMCDLLPLASLSSALKSLSRAGMGVLTWCPRCELFSMCLLSC